MVFFVREVDDAFCVLLVLRAFQIEGVVNFGTGVDDAPGEYEGTSD
jgi:hypothetical protein